MRGLCACVLVASLAAGSTALGDICGDIRRLGSGDGQITLALSGSGAPAQCARSAQLSGAEQVHCRWSFEYRSSAASEAFAQLVSSVTACFGQTARVTTDKGVNHPDFYDLRLFQSEGREIGVSFKDKVNLSKTFVFLRVTSAK